GYSNMKQRKIKRYFIGIMLCSSLNTAFTQNVTVTVNATQNKHAVSPYIYGRNNTFDQSAQFYKDAGLLFVRMNGGNNATKYNWRKKITSHPDWYNNVYGCDWDATSQQIASDFPDMKVMWAFQLIGRTASSTNYNFNDWGFNQSKYWSGVNQNLAGGGIPDTAKGATKALKEGDVNLYTEPWPSDSTVAILNHWFGTNGLGLNKNQFLYWNMDNEPDVWDGTHDDVMPTLISASDFMDRFIEVAKKAKALFPGIKICGPVTTSEWQWYKWGSQGITINGKYYCWLEYFIKRCADEEKASGVRVLDVVDLHNYPYAKNGDIDALQLHRMYYDTTYDYPGANGLKTINGGWDNSQTKEYIFKRINNWLTEYFGPNNGITPGISEWSPASSDPNVASVVYGSHLGTFANNGVEYFTPWTWVTGMWETLHLYSRYEKKYSVSSTSSLENTVSAYTTVNDNVDSMTVIIVNRDMSSTRNVTVNLSNISIADSSYATLQLSSLPSTETFKSNTDNALKKNSVRVSSNSFNISVPALSTTAVLLQSTTTTGIKEFKNQADDIKIFPNPVYDKLYVSMSSIVAEPTQIIIFDQEGRQIRTSVVNYDGHSPIDINLSSLSGGFYLLSVKKSQITSTKRFAVIR
ncbi:MAG TPA: glycoside hydrolase family 44 protein, partial [Bacteroidales bacterium]